MEARRRFGEIMNRVALKGEKFTVERAGKPLACIVPVEESGSSASTLDIFGEPFATFNEWNDPSNDAYDQL